MLSFCTNTWLRFQLSQKCSSENSRLTLLAITNFWQSWQSIFKEGCTKHNLFSKETKSDLKLKVQLHQLNCLNILNYYHDQRSSLSFSCALLHQIGCHALVHLKYDLHWFTDLVISANMSPIYNIGLFWLFLFQMKFCVGNMTWYFREDSFSLSNDTALGLWFLPLKYIYTIPHISQYNICSYFAHLYSLSQQFSQKITSFKKSWVGVDYS